MVSLVDLISEIKVLPCLLCHSMCPCLHFYLSHQPHLYLLSSLQHVFVFTLPISLRNSQCICYIFHSTRLCLHSPILLLAGCVLFIFREDVAVFTVPNMMFYLVAELSCVFISHWFSGAWVERFSNHS